MDEKMNGIEVTEEKTEEIINEPVDEKLEESTVEETEVLTEDSAEETEITSETEPGEDAAEEVLEEASELTKAEEEPVLSQEEDVEEIAEEQPEEIEEEAEEQSFESSTETDEKDIETIEDTVYQPLVKEAEKETAEINEAEETELEDGEAAEKEKSDATEELISESVEKTEAEGEDKTNQPKKRNPLLYVLGALLSIIVISYVVGVVYFSSHFFLTVEMNGEDIAGFTEEEATKVFTEKEYDSHKIILVERDRQETITPQEVDLQINVGTQVADALKNQNQWLWFMNMTGTRKETIQLDISYNEEKLKETVDGLEAFKEENIVAPENAYIKAGETQFEIVPEVEGTTVLKDDLLTAIDTAFKTMQTSIDLDEQELYKKATVRSTHKRMNEALEKANKYAKSKVTYDFEYRTLDVDYNKFKDWIDISSDYKKVTFNDEKLDDYVTKLCADFNTMGIYREFKTATGKTITITEGDYGWKIYYLKEREKLEENLKSGKEVKRKPIYSYEAMTRDGASDDIGDTYVEVSIASQTVYLFVDGKQVLSSPVVTGDITKSGRATHTGIYSITFKKRNTSLTGQGYSSPVSYWMPFNGNEGLHDASWRSSFGGSIYKGNGSHGCVNCPPSVAKTIYENIDEGYPVIVY